MTATIGHNSGSHIDERLQFIWDALETGLKRPKFPYFKFYPQDWLDGTRNLTLEQRGAFMDMISLFMANSGRVPDDPKWVSHQLHVSTRKWVSLRSQLMDAGKIASEGGFLINERCISELSALLDQSRNRSDSASVRERSKRGSAPAQPRTSAEPALNQARTDDEKSENVNEINDRHSTVVPLRARVLDLDTDIEKEDPSPPVSSRQISCEQEGRHTGRFETFRPEQPSYAAQVAKAAALAGMIAASPMMAAAADVQPQAVAQAVTPHADLQARLIEAAGPALANPAACPGLLVPSEPRRWLAAGIDLEVIILPAIRARCAAAKAGTIRSWGYFTQAIADAQATATSPMPSSVRHATPDLAEAARAQRRKNYDMGERTSEQYLTEECISKKRWTKAAVGLWGNPDDCAAVLVRLGAKDGEWKNWGE